MEVRIQSVVVEFILNNTEALFSSKLNTIIRESTGGSEQRRHVLWWWGGGWGSTRRHSSLTLFTFS